MSKIEEMISLIRVWLEQQYDYLHESESNHHLRRRRQLHYFIVIVVLPLLASFILIQLQQEQQIIIYTGLGFAFIGLWRSVLLGIASLITSLWHFCLRIVGISLGIGLGLGFAGHVYDALSETAQDATSTSARARRRQAVLSSSSSPSTTAAAAVGELSSQSSLLTAPNYLPKDALALSSSGQKTTMEDANSYRALMRGAGYSVANGTLRAQMVRGNQASVAVRANDAKRRLKLLQFEQNQHPNDPRYYSNDVQQQCDRVSLYKFDKGQTASMRMKCMWPNLAPVVNEALAKLIEFVLRDYVSSWYSKVDENVVYYAAESPSSSSRNVSTTTSVDSDSISKSPGRSMDGADGDATILANGDRKQKQFSSSLPPRHDSPGSSHHQLNSFGEDDDASSCQQRSQSLSYGPSSRSLSNSFSNDKQQSSSQQQQQQQQKRIQQQKRTMVLTTTGTQPSPFIDSLYSCFAYMLGMFATRASENVNVLELLLLHFPHVLGQNLRVYREMKNLALEKKLRRAYAERERLVKERNNGEIGDITRSQLSPSSTSSKRSTSSVGASGIQQSVEVSEIAIVREYLLTGKFHRAITFGLDIPSLLFADPLAKDCPPGSSYHGNSDCDRVNGHPDEDAILYDRLLSLESSLIGECETDYIRVLASKLTKLLIPKTEVDSTIVRAMAVETLASCVLGPVMGCFTPDNVNRWIVLGLELLDGKESEKVASSSSTKSEDAASHTEGVRKNIIETNPTSFRSVGEGTDSSNNLVDSVIDENVSGGSVASSDMDESLFGTYGEGGREKEVRQLVDCSKAEQIITLLSMSIIELGRIVDFCQVRTHGQDNNADWDSQSCQDAVRHLVLVIEAALLFGARCHPKRQHSPEDMAFSEFEIEATLDQPDEDEFEVDLDDGLIGTKVQSSVQHKHASLSAALMEITGDIDAFENLVETVEEYDDDSSSENEHEIEIIIPKPNELSTLRTLIAAWLHTGQAFKVLSIVVQAKQTILQRFFHKSAFLRRDNYARDFTKLLRQLDGVNILVDTMAVLESKCLLQDNGFDSLMKRFHQPKANNRRNMKHIKESRPKKQASNASLHSVGNSSSVVGSVRANIAHNRSRIARFAQSATEIDLNPWKDRTAGQSKNPLGANIAHVHHQPSFIAPAYLTFSKNEVFASNIRSERERRHGSWSNETKNRKRLDFVSRTTGMKEKDILMHRELHNLSRSFYSNTNEIRIEPCASGDDQSLSSSTANITVKGVGTRRMIEVPDEDSSFLLRASPRPLKPKAIQPDRRNPNAVCKIYVAMYEAPAIHPKTKRFYGGRYLRQCLMRYYPNDKTASVSVAKSIDVLDCRFRESRNEFALSEDFQKLRHTCLKVATGGILSSPLMEPGDFCSTPRTGRAIDFAHKISLFERPMVELGGKKFVIHDASSHRADASSLELSDASMTAALILRGSGGLNVCESSGGFNIKVSEDGTPLILLRANRELGSTPKSTDEARPYRPSFIRAALLIKSAKQEARYQCILSCIRNGSARSSSKVKSDEWLQPTLTLLEYANSRQQEQSILQRDLRFGVNHIDRGQLRRNGLLNPRYPTILRALNTKVEGVVEVKGSDFDILGLPTLLFRIRCTAIAEYVGDGDDDELTASSISALSDEKRAVGTKSRFFREEWTVLRSLKDFTAFHKFIKSQVSQAEHSASTSAKLVGSVSAALTIVGGNAATARQRGPLVPSLAQAVSASSFGLNVVKRTNLLDQYLKYLVSPKNLISRCPELLTFLGAYTSVFPLDGIDEYGRESITREELVTDKLKAGIVQVKQGHESASSVADSDTVSIGGGEMEAVSSPKESGLGKSPVTQDEEIKPAEKNGNHQNHAAREVARLRAGEISLKDVRGSIFQLLTHLFDLGNASFFRSRVISVLKTMSVAVASVQYFQLLLFKTHVNYMNGAWISRWILYFVDMFWPNGVFYKKEPPMNGEELLVMKRKSKQMINKMFPDQLRKVLGRHTDEGLDLLHEMLQNRLVLKSMAYMLLDLVWVEIFPELGDFVTGAECLEKDA